MSVENTIRIPTGRAVTPEEKIYVIGRILAAWLKSPHERLGQLLVNAKVNDDRENTRSENVNLFHVEDYVLADMVKRMVNK